MLKSSLLTVSVLGLFAAPTVFAAPLKISGCAVTFIAKGKPGFLTINGTGADCSGNLESDGKNITGEITSPMSKFGSGIAMRDEHMKDKYMEVKKFPDAVLKLTKFESNLTAGDKKDFKGILKFHGQEKEVEGTATAKIVNGKGTVEADYSISLKDFGIDVPTYAGVTVSDKVDINTKFDTVPGAGAVAAAPAPAPAAAAPAKGKPAAGKAPEAKTDAKK